MNNLIIKEVYRMSLFSKMSFHSSSELNWLFEEQNSTYAEILKIIKNNNIQYFEDSHLKYYIFKHNNTIFIIFNSTLMYTIDRTLAKYKEGIYMHKGLLQQFQDIEDNLYYNIHQINQSKTLKKIYIGGYYMGGGLATIAASIIAEKYKNMFLVSCFTFESPMVGNCAFKRFFKEVISNNYRVILEDTSADVKCSLDIYNCYKHHIYLYALYNKFYDGAYCHVSNALQLTPEIILEIKKPRLSKTDRLFKQFYKGHQSLIFHTCNL
jgi:poly(3-hydroxyalkanoate) synthetase